MAAPVLEKTWQKTTVVVPAGTGPANQVGASDGDSQFRQCMFEIKNAMVSFASGAWTVVSSCGYDSGSWSFGAADYWVTSDDVRFKEQTGAQFSWIVLQQNGIKTGYQLLIAMENAYNNGESPQVWYVSHSGAFTGGDATTRPTASDEVSFTENTRRWEDASSYDASITVWMSTDGACTRIMNTLNNAFKHLIGFEKLKSMADPSVFEGQSVCGCLRSREAVDIFCSGDELYKAHSVLGKQGTWNGLVPYFTGGVLPLNTTVGAADPTGEYPVTAIPIWSQRPYYLLLGEMYDCYAVSNGLIDGDGFPDDDSNDFIVIGDFIIGNDGTNLVIA